MNSHDKVTKNGKQADFSKAQWHKSNRSNPSGNCVEVAFVDELIGVRDSKDPQGPKLVFTKAEWNAFIGGTKDGEFDLAK